MNVCAICLEKDIFLFEFWHRLYYTFPSACTSRFEDVRAVLDITKDVTWKTFMHDVFLVN